MTRFASLVMACLMTGCSFDIPAGETQRETHAIELDGSPQTRVDLQMGAGELRVTGGAAKLLEGEFTYNADRLKPVVEHQAGAISISQPDSVGFTFGNVSSRWDLRLNDDVPLDVSAKLGAGEAELNLGDLDLRGVAVEIGAGEVRVDLRGNPTRSYPVRVNGGVGETVLYLPRGVGISAAAAGGLGSITVDGLEKRGERWINAGHEDDAVQLTVDVKGGIGEIRIVAQ